MAAEKEVVKGMSLDWALDFARAQEGDVFADWAAFEPGDGPTFSSGNGLCVLVSKIPLAGPQGRMYWPGWSRELIRADGTLIPSFREDVQERFDKFKNELFGKGFDMVMRRDDGTFNTVRTLSVKSYAGRQDRRLQRSRQ